jgi:hypothetical protein
MQAATEDLLPRLGAVEARLRTLSTTPLLAIRGHLTDADPGTGEQWEWGQVWAHLAEFIPYWIAQAQQVIGAYHGEPVPFGRVKGDPERIAAIDRDRTVDVAALWARLDSHIAELRAFLGELPDSAWAAQGVHQTLGVMSMPHIVDEFLVGHLEQHAAQLDGLVGTGTGAG